MRAFVFNTSFWSLSGLFAIVCTPLAFIPGRYPLSAGLWLYTRTIVGLMRLHGIDVRVRGRERVPADQPVILAAKHQSYGDGIVMMSRHFDVAFVTGDHLLKFPLIGYILRKAGAVVVDNAGGARAKNGLQEGMAKLRKSGRHVLIYPEGHLVGVGEKLRYRKGVYHLYTELNRPVVPVATSLGLRWPKQEWRKIPGRAVVEMLEPIPPGLSKAEFMVRLEAAVESRTCELVEECRR